MNRAAPVGKKCKANQNTIPSQLKTETTAANANMFQNKDSNNPAAPNVHSQFHTLVLEKSVTKYAWNTNTNFITVIKLSSSLQVF